MKAHTAKGDKVTEGIRVIRERYPLSHTKSGDKLDISVDAWDFVTSEDKFIKRSKDKEGLIKEARILNLNDPEVLSRYSNGQRPLDISFKKGGFKDCILVLWLVRSGPYGRVKIYGNKKVIKIGYSQKPNGNVEIGEMLTVLKPGQMLYARRSGRGVKHVYGKLFYDGKSIIVTFGGEEMKESMPKCLRKLERDFKDSRALPRFS